MTNTITIGTNTITVVSLPQRPGPASVEFRMSEAVAYVPQPFTGQGQRQAWPGSDFWAATLTLPPLKSSEVDFDAADDWTSFLAELRGMRCAVMIGDPRRRLPKGELQGSVPVVDSSVTGYNAAMTETLYIKGLTPNASRLILRGTNVQVGYRLHRLLVDVSADGNGKAAVPVWPSLREQPADGAAITLSNPCGLFGLGQNQRSWSDSPKELTRLSVQLQEYR